MPSSFRRIADELDPNFVPESARRGRRPVPVYARTLLAFFGPWWLPRIGLALVLAGVLLEIAGMVVFASRSWVPGIVVFGGGVLTAVAGSAMWGAYRMRHWLQGGAASAAPLLPPVPRRVWAWMFFAVLAIFGGLGLMMWLIAANGSVRAIVVGVGIFMVCAGTGAAVVLSQMESASEGRMTFAGLPARRVALIYFVISLALAISLLAQAPLLPATR